MDDVKEEVQNIGSKVETKCESVGRIRAMEKERIESGKRIEDMMEEIKRERMRMAERGEAMEVVEEGVSATYAWKVKEKKVKKSVNLVKIVKEDEGKKYREWK